MFCSVLCGSLDGRRVWGRMDTFPSCCSPETIMTLLICCSTIQNKKFKRKKEQHSVFILEHALVLFAYICVVMYLSPAGMWPSLFWAGDSHASFLFSRCMKSQKDGQAGRELSPWWSRNWEVWEEIVPEFESWLNLEGAVWTVSKLCIKLRQSLWGRKFPAEN